MMSRLLLLLTPLLVSLPCTLAASNASNAEPKELGTDVHCSDSDPRFDFHYTLFFKSNYPKGVNAEGCGFKETGIQPDICQRYAVPPAPRCYSIPSCSIATFAETVDLPVPAQGLCWQCWVYRNTGCVGDFHFFQRNQNPLPEEFSGNIKSFVCNRFACSDIQPEN